MKRVLSAVLILVVVLVAAPISAQREDRESLIRRIATSYRAFGRVDDELRWAPYLCRLPLPSLARVSRAESVHGRKVYFIYASDREQYLTLTGSGRAQPRPGLTVVKESFEPRPVDARGSVRSDGEIPSSTSPSEHGLFHRDVFRAAHGSDGRAMGPGAPKGLFIMHYLGARARGTDDGWIYSTVSADGTITSLGRNEQCMSCHRAAPHRRLFGLAE